MVFMPTDFKNILLIQTGDIGDVVLTTPSICATKKTFPHAKVSILVRKPFGSLLAADPNLAGVLEAERIRGPMFHGVRKFIELAIRLHRSRYDLVIDLRTGDRGAILAFLTGAPHKIGCRNPDSSLLGRLVFSKMLWNLPPGPTSTHPGADQCLRFLRALGMDTTDSSPKLYVAPNDLAQAVSLLARYGLTPERKRLTINPFSRWKYKEWDNQKWGEVIDQLWKSHGIPSVLIGSAEEASACQQIVSGREGHAFNIAGTTTLGELAAIISMSTLHLGVDSAAPHMAEALGIPSVTLHGPSDWRAWRKIDERHRVVMCPDMDCAPCSQTGCDNSGRSRCMEQLRPDCVIDAAHDVLQFH